MDQKQKIKLAVGAVTVVVLFVLISATVFAGTTIGTNITTTGTLSVSNNADFTLGSAKRILIDAATTDATLTTGVVDLNVDVASGSTGVRGQDMTMNIIGGSDQGASTDIGLGYVVSINAPTTGLQTNNTVTAFAAQFGGTANDESGSKYVGTGVLSAGTPGGSAEYFGNFTGFHSSYGGVNMQNSGSVSGNFVAIQKTTGTGNIYGVNLDLDNSSSNSNDTDGIYANLSKTAGTGNIKGEDFVISNSSSGTLDIYGEKVNLTKSAGSGNIYGSKVDINNSSSASGVNISGSEILLDLGSTALSSSIGLYISEDGSGSQALQDGILIVSNNDNGTGITDAIDVADDDITNALRIGTNTIAASGDFSISISSSDNNNINILNTGGSLTASLILDGGITIGSTTSTDSGTKITKHLSTTGTVGNGGAGIAANTCITDSITVIGAVATDTVVLGPPSNLEASLIGFGLVSSTSTVTVRLCNPTAGAIVSADLTWRVDVWQH